MTDFYRAIHQAADHIEAHPDHFDFIESRVPDDACGSPSCALGWIGYFAGIRSNKFVGEWSGSVAFRMCTYEGVIYERLTDLVGIKWYDRADVCAKGLRLYAELYYGYQKPPVWAAMRDREMQARLEAQPAYERFRQGLQLESVPQAPPGNSVPSNEPAEDDEIL